MEIYKIGRKRIIEKLSREHADIQILFKGFYEIDSKEFKLKDTVNSLAKIMRRIYLHFKLEEQIINDLKISGAELHRLEHRCCVYFIEAFYLKLSAGKIFDLSPLQIYLKEWQKEHE